MGGADTKWITLAKDFPAGLDTETDPSDLKDGFTPDAYGLNIDYPGRLVAQSSQVDNGDVYTARAFTIGDPGADWTWFLRRLWRINGQNLEYNAPEYQEVILYQDLDGVSFDEIAGQVLHDFFPVGGSMFVGCTGGGYLVSSATSLGGDYQHGDIEEQMYITNALCATPLDNEAFVSNADGIYRWQGNGVGELTELVRSDIAFFSNRALRINEPKRRLIGCKLDEVDVVNFVYDKAMDKLFVYNNDNTDFRWTSKTVTDNKSKPFATHKVKFYYDNTTGARGKIKFQNRIDRDWYDEQELAIEAEEGEYHTKDTSFETQVVGTGFSLRLTDLDPHIHISRIDILTEANTNEETPSQ